MNISADTVYWLLSTTAQVYAALIAVFGALAVFRWQVSSQFRRDVRHLIVDILSWFLTVNFAKAEVITSQEPHGVPTDRLRQYWEEEFSEEIKMRLERDFPRKYYSLIDGFDSIDTTRSHRRRLLASTVIMTGVFLFFIAASLLGLFRTAYLAQNQNWLVGLTELALTLTFIIAGFHFWVVFMGEPKKEGGKG